MNNNYSQLLNSAMDMMEIKNISKAEEILLSIIKQYPDKLEGYYLYGILKSRFIGDLDGAISILKRGLDIVPFFDGLKVLAECYMLKKDTYNAEKYLKLALIYNSTNEECLSYLNNVFPKLKNYINNEKTYFDKFYENSKDCTLLKYKKIYDGGHLSRTIPHYIDEMFTDKQKQLLKECIDNYVELDYDEGFTVEIPNGKVYLSQGSQPYIFAPDGKYLKDVLDSYGPLPAVEEMPNSVRCADNLLVLSHCYSGNYYHWLTFTVPRLYMIEKAGYNLNRFDKIAISYLGYNYQKELLELLNIPKNKIIATVPKGVVLSAKNLITTSTPQYKITPPIVIQSLREKLLNENMYDDSFPKKIYLSRNKSGSRHVLNEDILTEYLRKEGFEIIYAEDLSVINQIKYFANADIIISQHGAGLTNIIFSKEGTKLLEIFNDNFRDHIDTGFVRLAADRNLKHLLMFGKSLGQDIIIDMNNFKINYEYLLNL